MMTNHSKPTRGGHHGEAGSSVSSVTGYEGVIVLDPVVQLVQLRLLPTCSVKGKGKAGVSTCAAVQNHPVRFPAAGRRVADDA